MDLDGIMAAMAEGLSRTHGLASRELLSTSGHN